MGFLAGLLGLGKLLRDFVVKNWKIAIPIIAAVFIFLWTKDHYYQQGVDNTTAKWEKRVEDETRKNKDLNQKLLDMVTRERDEYKKERDDRHSREKTHTERIETIVKNNPVYTQCLVDAEVVNSQNALKGELR